jgi:NAD(P)H-dependent flavin oxidoreductase YrpB (nitropropane dioxygenase family)
MNLSTPLCDLLGIDLPIFSVGFGVSAGPELVAAVSNAGAFGVVGGTGVAGSELQKIIARTHTLTDRPIGVNLIIADLDVPDPDADAIPFLDEQVAAVLEAGVDAIVFFWGPLDRYIDQVHTAGALVFLQVGSVEEGREAIAAGADAVIAQGFEAGGHVRGRESIWEVLPRLVEAVRPAPVLASGGIGDGAGIARALRAGAQGVSLGTRFVATAEAFIHPAFKRRVVESTAADTVYAPDLFYVNWPEAPHRVLRNRTVREWEAAGRPPIGQRPGEGTTIGTQHRAWGDFEWPRYATGMVTPDFEGDPDLAPMWCGESCTVVNDIKPAAEVIADLVRDATAATASRP